MHNYKINLDCQYVSVYGLKEFLSLPKDTDLDYETECTIKYSVEFESRDWGIKSVCVVIEKIVATITAKIYKDEVTSDMNLQGWEDEGDIFSIKLSPDFSSWQIKHSVGFVNYQLAPSEAEIDFNNKRITIL